MMPMTKYPPLPPRAGAGAAPAMAPAEEPVEEMAEQMTGGEGKIAIAPEAVCYRDEMQRCGNCAHMQADGECEALEMPVSEGAGCNLFTERQ